MALFDAFLKIDGIPGESTDSRHITEIDLDSFSWGAAQAGTFAAGGGGGAGKVRFTDFTFTMKVNKASPKLMLACAGGDHIRAATLTIRKSGAEQYEFVKVTLSDVLVSSYQTSASESSSVLPVDQVSLNFTRLEVEYKEQKADGTLSGAVKAGWDAKANRRV